MHNDSNSRVVVVYWRPKVEAEWQRELIVPDTLDSLALVSDSAVRAYWKVEPLVSDYEDGACPFPCRSHNESEAMFGGREVWLCTRPLGHGGPCDDAVAYPDPDPAALAEAMLRHPAGKGRV